MTCGEVQPFINDYADNSLDEHKEKEIKEHIDSCPDCQGEIDSIVLLKALLKAFAAEEPTCEYFEKATASIIAKTTGGSAQSEEAQ